MNAAIDIRGSQHVEEINKLLAQGETRHIKVCQSDWQKSYSQFHSQQVANPSSAKYLVAIPNLSGLADRIIGIITVCLIAILTNRVFQIGQRSPLPPLQIAFNSPYINWTRAEDAQWLYEPLKHDATIRNYNSSVIESKEYYAINVINDYRLQDRFLRQDLVDLMGGDAKTTMMVNNRGKTLRMFENPVHQKQLHKTGMTPYTAFGCLGHFLFKPKPEIFTGMLPILRRMVSEDSVLRIAIQIRVGDVQFANQHRNVPVSHFSAFFDCAKQIESFALKNTSYKSAVWYLLTESMLLRKSAVKEFGEDKVLSSLDSHIEHSAKESSVCRGANCTVSSLGFDTAAAEWWMMSFADYHVISQHSGYGRSAAMMSLRQDSIYTVRYNKAAAPIVCSNASFTDLETLFYDWSGI